MSDRKKFFIITTVGRSFTFFKGQARLWQKSFDVTAISAEEDRLKIFAEKEGIAHKYMPMHREISPIADVVCLFRLIWLFLLERPFIVHGNTPKASMLSMLAAWITRRPVRIYMCHGLRYQTEDGVIRRILMGFEKVSCACANRVLCVSNGVKEQLISDGLCKSRKAKVVCYGTSGGIDTVHFSRRNKYDTKLVEDLKLPDDAFVFTFVGRIVRDKGINELVSAFQRLSNEYQNVYLILIGSREQDLDPISNKSLYLIESHDRILELGRQSDIRPFLAVSQALVLPSYREGVGQVLLEAGCMDVPCIASDIIGCNEVIVPEVNGELIPPRNVEELYSKMKEWVANPAKVSKMAKSSRRSIVERFEREKVWAAYLSEYSCC